MADLASLAAHLIDGSIEVVDLTSPLHAQTPILQLPPEFGQTAPFELEEISRYDDRGPAWYWNNFRTGEHTGTHLDAPNHWITGSDQTDVSQIPPQRLVGPAVVIDKVAEALANPDFLLDIGDLERWQQQHGPLPARGWLLFRTGWSSRGDDPAAFANADGDGAHTPGVTPAAAKYLADSDLLGLGVETVGTDAGQAFRFAPAFPCHEAVLGAGKYGLTQLRNLDRLPTTGAIVIAAPLPIVTGSGSPPASSRWSRGDRKVNDVAHAVGTALGALGVKTVFGVVGSGNFHVTNALTAAGARFVAARHEGGAAVMADAYARVSGELGVLSVHQGPGLTNAMTGITEAAKSRTPMLILAAEATSARSNFHIDQPGLAAAVGAVAARIGSAATAADDLARAYHRAVHERRTVLLNLPLNVQAETAPAPFSLPPQPAATLPVTDPTAIAALADVLAAARRPVFLAGRGARHASQDLKHLAERTGALLTTSAVSRGLFRGDPFNLDVSGGFATPVAAELIRDADLLVSWAARSPCGRRDTAP